MDPVPRHTAPARPLPPLTEETDSLIVRTGFGDDAAWERLLETVYRPDGGFPIDDYGDYFVVVDDPVIEGAAPEQVMAVVDDGGDVVMIADGTTMRDEGLPLLAVPMNTHIGHTFRPAPDRAGIMVVNLGLADTDISSFMDHEIRKALSWSSSRVGSCSAG
ncbi:DUF6924 domain-containing protein [Nocardiopsis tropica]|uniref:DUF6924 domain-containing protein n=1 Tax=Nocardiopsis tropica TaxID=109330 RepID=A0ABU7KVA2_9ACTN|nr:hypothetical protein [Nocardiopsis umidischolae]MEE2053222.1 hypothetical protein [Nocardiopsis umidischolae]